MAALDFPASPAIGTKYPNPPVAGVSVYEWDGEKWTSGGTLGAVPDPSNTPPLMDSTAAAGAAVTYSRGDHVHPSDTTRAPINSPVFTGNPQAPTPSPGDNDTSIATTAFVAGAVSASGGVLPATAPPLVDGVADVGVSAKYAREDHIHPIAPGSSIAITPVGGVAATTVQAAIAELDSEKVNRAGDTMTGDLTVAKASPGLVLNKAASGGQNLIWAKTANLLRWMMILGNATAEAGSDTGSDIQITPYNDAGSPLPVALTIQRNNGLVYVKADPASPLGVATKQYVDGKAAAATAAEYLANSAPTKMLTSGATWGAAAPVVLADAATVTPDFSLGIDFTWTIGAAGRTLANPTNIKPGQKGMLYLTQPAGGGATVTTWGSFWKFPGGTKPTLSAAAGAVDDISYTVKSATEIHCFPAAGMA